VGAGVRTPLLGACSAPRSEASAVSASEGVEEDWKDAVADDEGEEEEVDGSPFRGARPRVSDVMPSPVVRRVVTKVLRVADQAGRRPSVQRVRQSEGTYRERSAARS